jgi:hypothetical protein
MNQSREFQIAVLNFRFASEIRDLNQNAPPCIQHRAGLPLKGVCLTVPASLQAKADVPRGHSVANIRLSKVDAALLNAWWHQSLCPARSAGRKLPGGVMLRPFLYRHTETTVNRGTAHSLLMRVESNRAIGLRRLSSISLRCSIAAVTG